MTEPILDPKYWSDRIEQSGGLLYKSVFLCAPDKWKLIEKKHEAILSETIGEYDSILDVGCGYGRLLNLMPDSWKGDYVGVDISPDFIDLARQFHPNRAFINSDIRDIPEQLPQGEFDWAIMVSIRPMVRRDLGADVWDTMERAIRSKASKLLYLEYDRHDSGSIE